MTPDSVRRALIGCFLYEGFMTRTVMSCDQLEEKLSASSLLFLRGEAVKPEFYGSNNEENMEAEHLGR